MRNVYIKREKALACFGILYHCILGQEPQEHLLWAESQDRPSLMTQEEGSLRNGGTCCLSLGNEATSLFVIAYLEHGQRMTNPLILPAGTEDLFCTVKTLFNGASELSLELSLSDPWY